MLAGAANAAVVNEKVRAVTEAQAAATAAAAKAYAERAAKVNNFDGLVHNANGSKEFLEGGFVNGANSLATSQASVENEDGEVNEAVDTARALAHS